MYQGNVPLSGVIYGTLFNYKGALEALGEAVYAAPYLAPPQAPILYIKPRNTLNQHGKPIPLPKGVDGLIMGAALGVVMGKQATRVKEEEALDYVQGYTVVNDVSIFHDSFYRPAVKYLARDGFCPIAMDMVERKLVNNPDNLPIRLWINGQLRQENNTSNLIRPVSRLIADVSQFMTLFPGDILLVGVPEGAPKAFVNDRVHIEIDGVGYLENIILPEEKCWDVLSDEEYQDEKTENPETGMG